MYNNDYSYYFKCLSNVYTYALYYRCNVRHDDSGVFISPKNELDSRETFSIKFGENKENKPTNIIL